MEKFELAKTQVAQPVVQPANDEQKQIKKTTTQDVVENFTVAQRKNEIAMIDQQIASLQERQTALQADIDTAVIDLGLVITP